MDTLDRGFKIDRDDASKTLRHLLTCLPWYPSLPVPDLYVCTVLSPVNDLDHLVQTILPCSGDTRFQFNFRYPISDFYKKLTLVGAKEYMRKHRTEHVRTIMEVAKL